MENEYKPKIILAITKAHWGGAQKYVFDLANHLVDSKKYEVIVLHGGHGPLKTKLDQAEIKTEPLTTLGRDVDFLHDFKAFWRIYSFIKKEKPEILHLNSSKMLVLGAIAGRLAGCKKIIYTGHGWAFNEDRGPIEKYLIKLAYLFSLNFVDKIIFVSQTTRSQAENFGFHFSEEKTSVIYNGIGEIDFFSKEEARENIIELLVQKKNHIDKNDFWVGSIAELHTNKGLEYSIEAMRNLPENIHYVIVGGGEKRRNLETLIKAYNLQDKIFLTGPINGAGRLLKAFDLFILPSITEALPYVILEAGRAGLPVIASSVGGIPEIIENQKSGILLKAKDVVSLNNEILKLSFDSEKRLNLGHNLELKIKQDFSIENMFSAIDKIYQEML